MFDAEVYSLSITTNVSTRLKHFLQKQFLLKFVFFKKLQSKKGVKPMNNKSFGINQEKDHKALDHKLDKQFKRLNQINIIK